MIKGHINKDTPKAESERAFNYFFVTELLKVIRLIIPNDSVGATTNELSLIHIYVTLYLTLAQTGAEKEKGTQKWKPPKCLILIK